MKFLLVTTVLISGLTAHTDDAQFSTNDDCQAARVLVLRNAAMTNALMIVEQVGSDKPVSFEMVAVCKPISN